MSIFFAVLIAFCLFEASFPPKGSLFSDHMSISRTTAVKGVFVILVFFRHFLEYIEAKGPYDQLLVLFDSHTFQAIVTPFLFYSGYGIMESIKKKGAAYTKEFPVKRMLTFLLGFDFAIFLYLIMDLLMHKNISPSRFLMALIGWTSIGNSNWFVFCMLCSYLFSFIGMLIFFRKASERKTGRFFYAVFVSLLSLAYIRVLMPLKGNYTFWYDTIICFPLGIWYSLLREKINSFINNNIRRFLLIFCILLTGYAYTLLHRTETFLLLEANYILFVLLVIMMSRVICLNNSFLQYLGKHSFSFYILQRIPMIALSNTKIFSQHPYIFFIVSFVTVLLISEYFDLITRKLWQKILPI